MTLFPKILFPTDFTETANRALSQALRMFDGIGSELIVQHVVADYFERHPQWSTLFDVHELQKKMDFNIEHQIQRAVPAELQEKIKIRRVISKGRADEQITELADKEKVDVIVMGPAKAAVTGKVIRSASRPVLSVPAEYVVDSDGRKGVARMILATDFSEYSIKVVRFGFDLKKKLGCELDLVHVVETPTWFGNMIDPPSRAEVPEKMIEWTENQLKNVTPDEFLSDPSVKRIIETGSPAAVLAARVEARSADLLLLGAHGHGPIQKHLVGTTTDKILMRAVCPVLTVRV